MERTATFEEYMKFLMETHEDKPFEPSVFYNKHGDQFEICWESDNFYAVNVYSEGCCQFALHYSQEDDSVIGITLYGVKARLHKENMLTHEVEKQEWDRKWIEWASKQK